MYCAFININITKLTAPSCLTAAAIGTRLVYTSAMNTRRGRTFININLALPARKSRLTGTAEVRPCAARAHATILARGRRARVSLLGTQPALPAGRTNTGKVLFCLCACPAVEARVALTQIFFGTLPVVIFISNITEAHGSAA